MKTFIVKVQGRYNLPYYYVINGCKNNHDAIKRAIELHIDVGRPALKVELVKIISEKGHAIFSSNLSNYNLLLRR